jgi:hypothetical protein
MPSPAKIPRVAVWIETSRGYARGLIRGVADYVREHGPWSICFTPHGQHDPLPAWLRRWRGDGILARIESPQAARVLLETELPWESIARRTGFHGRKYLGDAFRRVTGGSPAEFRRQNRETHDFLERERAG